MIKRLHSMSRFAKGRSLLLILLLFQLTTSLFAAEFALPAEWNFALDPKNEGEKLKWHIPGVKNDLKKIKIGFWESQGYIYDGYAWYETSFKLPANAVRGGRVEVVFEGVDEDAKVWVNGMLMGNFSAGWNASFSVDVTSAMKLGEANILIVKVLDRMYAGGIWKPVKIKYDDKTPEYAVTKRLQKDKIRASSAGLSARFAAKMHEIGLNTAFSYSYILRKATPGSGDKLIDKENLPNYKQLLTYAQNAAKYDLIFIPKTCIHKETLPFLQKYPYRRAVLFNGYQCAVSPCPQDPVLWERVLTPIFRLFAEAHKAAGSLGGGSFDAEYYTGDGHFCYGNGAMGCYCDECFGGFLKLNSDTEKAGNIKLSERHKYIVDNYTNEEYLAYLERQVTVRARNLALEAWKIKDDFMLGVWPGAETWFLRGVARGFSKPGLPAIIVNESEYRTGYTEKTKHNIHDLEKAAFPYIYCPGLMISSYNAQGLAAKALELAQKTHGYWLYHGSLLFSGNARRTAKHLHHGGSFDIKDTQTNYHKYLKIANNYLNSNPQTVKVSGGKQFSFLNTEYFAKLPQDLSISSSGFAITPLPGGAKNLLKNSGSTAPLAQAWQSRSELPQVKDDTFIYDYSKTGDQPQYRTLYQQLELELGKTYQVKVELKMENVGGQLAGLQMWHEHPRKPSFGTTFKADDNEGKWQILTKSFKAPAKQVFLALVANGAGGIIMFRQPEVYLMRDWKLTSSQFTVENMQSTQTDFDRNSMQAFLVDPRTKMSYFELNQGGDEGIRYLNIIEPKAPAVLELDLHVPGNLRRLEIKQLSGNHK